MSIKTINKNRTTIAIRVERWESGADENSRNNIVQRRLFSTLARHLEVQYSKQVQWTDTESGRQQEARLVLFVFSKDEIFNLVKELWKEFRESEGE